MRAPFAEGVVSAVRLPTPRSLVPPVAAALVVVAGALLLWAGLERTAVLGGDAPVTGRLPAVGQPVVVTAPGMSELSGGEVTVTASADGSRPGFVGVGRADDVEAYLDGVARAEVTALEPDGTLRVVVHGGQPNLPDPAGVDVWAAAAQGTGSATLSWPRAPGSWRVVVAADGRTAPTSARFTWAGRAGPSSAPALIAVGAVVLVAGLAALLAIRSGRVFARRDPVVGRSRSAPASQGRPDSPRRAAAARRVDTGRAVDQVRTGDATGPIDVAHRADSPRRAAAAARGERPAGRSRTPATRPIGTGPIGTGDHGWLPDVDLRDSGAVDLRDSGPVDLRDADLRARRPGAARPPAAFADDPGDPDDEADDDVMAIQPFRHRRPGSEDQL